MACFLYSALFAVAVRRAAVIRRTAILAAVILASCGGSGRGADNYVWDNDDAIEQWYDLQGRRIERPKKAGMYIHNGKKVIIK